MQGLGNVGLQMRKPTIGPLRGSLRIICFLIFVDTSRTGATRVQAGFYSTWILLILKDLAPCQHAFCDLLSGTATMLQCLDIADESLLVNHASKLALMKDTHIPETKLDETLIH